MSERSEKLDQLALALAAAQADFRAIPKTDTNPFFKSKYAGLPAVVEAASPVLSKHGLSVTQFLGFDGTDDLLTTWLLHSSGQFIADTMRLHLPKRDSQGQGSATTYARRYSYMAALGLVADDDDDGNQASRPVQARPQASSAPRTEGNGNGDRLASAKQRGLIFVRAQENGLSNKQLAEIVLAATKSPPKVFADDEAAGDWLRRAMERLPSAQVNPILEVLTA
jgi:hypothetical protein